VLFVQAQTKFLEMIAGPGPHVRDLIKSDGFTEVGAKLLGRHVHLPKGNEHGLRERRLILAQNGDGNM
jgi:hypothetical protein